MAARKWQIGVVAAALALGTPALAQSGGSGGMGGSSSTTGSSTGSSRSSSAGSSTLDKDLQEAAQKLHAANLGEVQSGQAAQASAQSSEVKQFAQRMVDDHQKNDDQLQQLARTMGVSLQGDAFQKKQKDAQKDMDKVQGKTGSEFDKAYMSMMVDDHKKDAKEVEKAAKDAHKKNQSQLASFLDQTHSTMRMHLEEAQRIEKSLSSGGSGRASSSSGMSGTSGASTGSPSSGGTSGSTSSGSRGSVGGTTGAETGSGGAGGR